MTTVCEANEMTKSTLRQPVSSPPARDQRGGYEVWLRSNVCATSIAAVPISDLWALFNDCRLCTEQKFWMISEWLCHHFYFVQVEDSDSEWDSDEEVNLTFWKDRSQPLNDWFAHILSFTLPVMITCANTWIRWWNLILENFVQCGASEITCDTLQRSVRQLSNRDFEIVCCRFLATIENEVLSDTHGPFVLLSRQNIQHIMSVVPNPLLYSPDTRADILSTSTNVTDCAATLLEQSPFRFWKHEWESGAEATRRARDKVVQLLAPFLPADVCRHVLAPFILVNGRGVDFLHEIDETYHFVLGEIEK